MLPGTYWALVESILYSSWYLDAAHMDTDKHRLGKSGESRWGRGEARREKAGKRNDAARDVFRCIASQGEAISQARGRIWEQKLCSAKIQNGIGWRILGWYFQWKYQLRYKKMQQFTGQNHFERHQIRVGVPVYRCTVVLRHQWWHVHQWRDPPTE